MHFVSLSEASVPRVHDSGTPILKDACQVPSNTSEDAGVSCDPLWYACGRRHKKGYVIWVSGVGRT